MRAFYPDFVWKMPDDEKKIYLTFDDGPIPEITEFVIETLEKYHAKATFFCIGNNIEKNPNIFQKIIKNGHSVGNHTFNHLNGWKTNDKEYLENVMLNEKAINNQLSAISKQFSVIDNQQTSNDDNIAIIRFQQSSNRKSPISDPKSLFRPPYGRIKRNQAKALLPDYQIVMWDVLSGDFSLNLTPAEVLEKSLKHTKAGSIVLFHDSIKASKNMMYALPRFLDYFSEREYQFLNLSLPLP